MWPGQAIHVKTFAAVGAEMAQQAEAYAREFGGKHARHLSPPPPADIVPARRRQVHASAAQASAARGIITEDQEGTASGVQSGGGPESDKKRRRKNGFLQPINYAQNCRAALAFSQSPSIPLTSFQGHDGSGAVAVEAEASIRANEVLLHVQLQHRSRTTKVLEFAVLASQTLADFADAVYATDRWCLSSTVEDARTGEETQQQCNSGGDESQQSAHVCVRTPTYMFVENTFYVDTREPDNAAFADKSLAEFARDVTPPGQDTYSIKKMEDTFFGDLRVRPGVKYVFCHCGDCEHALVFTQMFRATVSDCRIPAEKYPLQVWKTRVLQRKCSICEKCSAQWATYGDQMSRTTPGFFCKNCFSSAHYSSTTEAPLFDFRCFPYYHDELQG